jgi:N-acyl-D-amino-acid deacylase
MCSASSPIPTPWSGPTDCPTTVSPSPAVGRISPRVGPLRAAGGLLSLEDAVYRMTGLSAAQFRLQDRGILKPGAYADLVVFDADEILDQASFEQPTRPASGIDYVVVNGAIAWSNQQPTGSRTGTVLKRPAI